MSLILGNYFWCKGGSRLRTSVIRKCQRDFVQCSRNTSPHAQAHSSYHSTRTDLRGSERPNSERHPSLPNLEPSGSNSRRGILRLTLFQRLFEYIAGYETVLQKMLPNKAFKAYKTFSSGSKSLFRDMTSFASVYGTLSASRNYQAMAATLSAKQLGLYLSLPAELRRVGPVLVVSALPMAQNVVFPLALMFPKILLSKHFWDEKLRLEVMADNIRTRHSYYTLIFKRMVSLQKATRGPAAIATLPLRKCLGKLANGKHPTSNDIIVMAPWFSSECALNKLPHYHLWWLVKIHENVGLFPAIFTLDKLTMFSNMLLEIDKALVREDPSKLDLLDLRHHCHVRGLNIRTSSEDQMRAYLNDWLRVSLQLKPHQATTLLHLPVLLGYNFRVKTSKRQNR